MYMSYKNCFYLTVNLLHPDGNQIINVVQENNSFCGTYMAYVNQIHRQNAFNVNIGSIQDRNLVSDLNNVFIMHRSVTLIYLLSDWKNIFHNCVNCGECNMTAEMTNYVNKFSFENKT